MTEEEVKAENYDLLTAWVLKHPGHHTGPAYHERLRIDELEYEIQELRNEFHEELQAQKAGLDARIQRVQKKAWKLHRQQNDRIAEVLNLRLAMNALERRVAELESLLVEVTL